MTRKLTLTSLAIAALLICAIGATVALAADEGQAPPPPPGPQLHGPGGHGGPGGPGMHPGRRGPRRGPGIGFRRGYIEPCPESKALWDKLGKLKIALHRKQWELFELLAQDQPDREAIKAKLKEIVAIRREMAKVQKDLRKYWRPLPGRGDRPGPVRALGRGGPGRGGPGRGMGGQHGRGGGQLPPPGQ